MMLVSTGKIIFCNSGEASVVFEGFLYLFRSFFCVLTEIPNLKAMKIKIQSSLVNLTA